ncbi:hypothetical protein [Burkholderia ambifaria]|uniref:hypothetical protein n=1 Tax=Burkholderia ambifaria TaxID=152480 RepID=UPI001ABAFFE7|nr:hypothetical protein [Burkholderia ambifaria]
MQGKSKQDYFKTSDGIVRIWIEEGASVHIKAAAVENDPVKLSESEAMEIAEILNRFATRI